MAEEPKVTEEWNERDSSCEAEREIGMQCRCVRSRRTHRTGWLSPVDVCTPAAAPQLGHQTLADAGKSACESERRYLPSPAWGRLLSGQAQNAVPEYWQGMLLTLEGCPTYFLVYSGCLHLPKG
ncbi:hypothetical protein [Kamptonema formosum]|uniref:hypothetical protein n=1 Tax=Kamptonema formosum TaxID=331992 RepID=UPI0012DBD8F9|nr:hypothetical protein [Oscillatoria sp. PCC 10802]